MCRLHAAARRMCAEHPRERCSSPRARPRAKRIACVAGRLGKESRPAGFVPERVAGPCRAAPAERPRGRRARSGADHDRSAWSPAADGRRRPGVPRACSRRTGIPRCTARLDLRSEAITPLTDRAGPDSSPRSVAEQRSDCLHRIEDREGTFTSHLASLYPDGPRATDASGFGWKPAQRSRSDVTWARDGSGFYHAGSGQKRSTWFAPGQSEACPPRRSPDERAHASHDLRRAHRHRRRLGSSMIQPASSVHLRDGAGHLKRASCVPT